MRWTSAYIFTALLLSSPVLEAETLVYRDTTGNDIVMDTYVIDKSESGYHITLHSTWNGRPEWICAWDTDASFSVREWEFQNVREKTKVKAVRRGNVIRLRGTHMGKPIEKDFAINVHPWKQHFPFGLEPFIRSAEKTITFWSIGTKGQGDMQAGEFYAEKQERADVPLADGRRIQALHVRMNLTGFLAAFWHCDTWFRAGDGRYLRYEAVNGQGNTPRTVVELIEEKK
jgi:hypothetical protein